MIEHNPAQKSQEVIISSAHLISFARLVKQASNSDKEINVKQFQRYAWKIEYWTSLNNCWSVINFQLLTSVRLTTIFGPFAGADQRLTFNSHQSQLVKDREQAFKWMSLQISTCFKSDNVTNDFLCLPPDTIRFWRRRLKPKSHEVTAGSAS